MRKAADVSISKALRATAKSGETVNGTEGVWMIKANLLRAATAVLGLRVRHSLTADIIDFHCFQLLLCLSVCLSLKSRAILDIFSGLRKGVMGIS